MKKLALTAIAGLMAVLGTASIASADHRRGGDDEMWRHHDRRGDHDGWRHHHWKRHHHGPRVVFRGHFRDDFCFIKKVRRYDDWGNMYIKRVRICR